MEFHISRAVRDKLKLDDLLFSYSGNVVFANVAASRKLAQKMNECRGADADPAGAVNGGALFAMGLIDELSHAMVERYRKEIDPAVLSEAVKWFAARAAPARVEELLLAFAEHFPNIAVYRGEITAAEWLKGRTDDLSNREAALEELLLLWVANINPAVAPFRELFEDKVLKQQTIYERVTETFGDYFSTRPLVSPEVGTLFDALRAPILASPDSLTGQLDFIREHWTRHLGEDLRRVLLAIDVVREEDIAVWMRFHPPGPDQYRHGAPGFGAEGFVGDEYVGFEQDFVVGPDGVRHRRYAEDYQAPLVEYEAFSADQAWMPNVVLMAKSTYVWLEQLSKKYGRHIHRLDQIPDEELQLLATRGITGLWLIGLWERSTASRTIKRLRGHADAVASAYSLKGYDIAEDLGGTAGYEHLKQRAAAAGLRLASDMVPNHMGIDSDWVIERPEMFLYRWESPFPVYSFEGPDLSNDSRVEIKIEDHYYEQTDAAVVFRLRHHADGKTRYMYHGNDGTTFAWNDTAQLDYSQAMVREYVIQTILHVARLFPIIRFDAAMVLAKRHVQRLWFPLPGAGGSIPSRAENAMSQEEFEALMPHEFWREVVDRVAAEVPGTLLLAEAFWLLEGYFVRTLGMHRVYNSAFMNMLRDEENAKYRSYLKKTIEFDPDIMKRYVNFMSNPDEKTAIDQFGDGDKYFGVATLLATLPGLPMFAHGQIEGFGERYGMEFKQAKQDEWPNESLVARHQAEIAPLLHNRRIFAESENFTLYDFWNDHGAVDENVFAYSNRMGSERSIILYNNCYESTRGTIHTSAASMDKGSGTLRQRTLADGIGLAMDGSVVVAYRDRALGLEYLRRATEFHWHGLSIELRGYQTAVLLEWRELRSSAEYPWDRLCEQLNGGGVPNLEEALGKLRLGPLHQALREAVSGGNCRLLALIARGNETEGKAADVAGEASTGSIAVPVVAEVGKAVEAHGSVSPGVIDIAVPAGKARKPDARLNDLLSQAMSVFYRLEENVALPVPAPGAETAAAAYEAACRRMVLAATRLSLAGDGAVGAWPATVRALLPGVGAVGPDEEGWAPALAWILLRSLPTSSDRAQWFDELQLRPLLAEIFTSLGMQGDAMWRAAARVRLLFVHTGWASELMVSEAFWADGDVRWLAGVNESEGKCYFNKEQFEELLGWMCLPALLDNQDDEVVGETGLDPVAVCELAAAAGYELQSLLAGSTLREKTVPPIEMVVESPVSVA